ncbi:MAG: CoA pyrophosphatase [Glaciecola sp.]
MTETEFLSAFNQPWTTQVSAHEAFKNANRAAAVLICLYVHNNQLHVLFTERAQHLKHHPGQISFPGGKAEPSDVDLVDTAYREAKEEIGLQTNALKLLGKLGTYRTISGFAVTPIIAIYNKVLDLHKDLVLDHNEVASVFHVPLAFLMNEQHYFTEHIHRADGVFPVHFIPYNERLIWGATAGMLALLRDHVSAKLR